MVKSFAPLPSTLALSVPLTANAGCILDHVTQQLSLPKQVSNLLRLTRIGGQSVSMNTTVSVLTGLSVRNPFGHNVFAPLILEVRMALSGGKGGFGSMLRAQGGKMSSNRNGEENNDSCRDLNGRRLSTVKQARQLALYLSTQAEREKELSEAQQKKFAKLEKMLGRKPKGEADFVEAAQKLHDEGGSFEEDMEAGDDCGEGSSSSASISKPSTSKNHASKTDYKGKKRDRIEDSEYLEQSREIVDNVRSAVAMAMMKKKKKQKVASNNNAKSTTPAAQTV